MGSRRTGREKENEGAEFLGGKRISEAGMAGPDVEDAKGNFVEVKYRKRKYMPQWLQDWIAQMFDQDCEYLLWRWSRGRWLVTIDGELFRDKYLMHECECG